MKAVDHLEFDNRCMTCLSILGANFCSLIRTNTDAFDKLLNEPCIAVGALLTIKRYAEPLCKVHLEASINAYKQQSFVCIVLSMEQLWTKHAHVWFKWDGQMKR